MKLKLIIGLIIISILIISCAPSVDEEPQFPEQQIPVVVEEPVQEAEPEMELAIIEMFATVPSPDELTVKVGQEVVWRNRDRIPYTIIGDKQDFFKSSRVAPGDSYSRVYEQPGEYTYVLTPGKPGVIIVK